MMANKFSTTPIDIGVLSHEFKRADILFAGVDHSGASFEARVFLNNADANDQTPKTPQNGYAGSFHILGHGGCYGNVGHCEINADQRPFDPRPAHHLVPVKKTLIATEAIRKVRDAGSTSVTVTVVPIVTGYTDKCDLKDVLHLENVSIATYQ